MTASTILSVASVLMAVLGMVMGYAIGPPIEMYPEVCVSMHPVGHNATAQSSPAPFVVKTTCHCYVPDQYIYVDYKVNDGHDPLEGIFIQARRTTGDTNTAVGTFIVDPKKELKSLSCNDNKNSAVSQSDEVKERNKGGCWRAPSDLGGVKFVATALLHTAEFWEFVSSADLNPCPGGTVPEECKTTDTLVDANFCVPYASYSALNAAPTLQPVGLVTGMSLTVALQVVNIVMILINL